MKRAAAGDMKTRLRQLRVRRGLLLGAFCVAAVAVLGRAFQLQAIEGDAWAREALDQQRERVPLPARRGAIYDRDGVPLALSYETFRISVAPGELSDRAAAIERLTGALGVSRAEAERATNPSRKWVVLPGRFSVEQRQALGDPPGFYPERQLERFYPQGEIGREVIGVVTRDGRALGGIEQEFDATLRGEPGYSILRRDARGDVRSSISLPVVPPRDGADVYLTIDFDMQQIADAALRAAIDSAGATGGDLVLLDPRTGDVLAAVSKRGGKARSLTAITEPYEPGSTLKPFAAATLIAENKVAPRDTVFVENGRWVTPERTITDADPMPGWITLADVIRESSNIGISKFTARLDHREQYTYLRAFGFGTPTGVEFPAESSGRLRTPDQWSKLSSQSLAMGYEISVTPLQLAAAYGCLANGGVLMEPHLLEEIRARDGSALEHRDPRVLRRVVPDSVASRVTRMLIDVVQDGTATQAGLDVFEVAGKTGTAKRTGPNGHYVPGSYTASFAGFFPAQDPRIVILVKIDNPHGDSYYGGATAAPVSRQTLRGILAAQSSGPDERRLLAALLPTPSERPMRVEQATMPADPHDRTYVFSLDAGVPPDSDEKVDSVAIPALAGLPLRTAAQRVHSLGLRVRIEGDGPVVRSDPEPGDTVMAGDTVSLIGATG